jgi:excisionase family DNA binding protein
MPPPDPGKFFDKQPTGSIQLLTVAKAAEMLGISTSGMRRLQQERCIPFFKVGRCVRFAKSDLAAYLTQHRVASVG